MSDDFLNVYSGLIRRYFDHVEPSPSGDHLKGTVRNYGIHSQPPELENKVYLLRNFESYMMTRLYGDQDFLYEDTGLTKGMVFVSRYLRMKHVILFRLSNDLLQVSLSRTRRR